MSEPKLRVKDVMSRDVVTLRPEDKIHDALEMLVENRVSALPVVDKRKNCVGIISTTVLVDFTKDVDEDIQHVDVLDPSSRRWHLSGTPTRTGRCIAAACP